MGCPKWARWMRIWCLRPVSGRRRSKEKVESLWLSVEEATSPQPSPPAEREKLLPPPDKSERENRFSTRNSVCAGAPSGRTQSLMATGLDSSLPSGASMTPCSAATWPWTMARYSLVTARVSQILPSSPAAPGFFASKTMPLVSRSRRWMRCGWEVLSFEF
jgi:hypothetical protein